MARERKNEAKKDVETKETSPAQQFNNMFV
jgi:hypothetical protein